MPENTDNLFAELDALIERLEKLSKDAARGADRAKRMAERLRNFQNDGLADSYAVALEEELPLGLDELVFPDYVRRNLSRAGIRNVPQLLMAHPRDLKKIEGIGDISLQQIVDALQERGLKLRE